MHEFEVSARRIIEHHEITCAIKLQTIEMRHGVLLRCVDISEEGAGGSNRQGMPFTAKSVQRADGKLLRQQAIGPLRLEMLCRPWLESGLERRQGLLGNGQGHW